MKRFFANLSIIITFTFLSAFSMGAAVRYHCASDSAAVLNLLKEASKGENIGARVALAAKALLGVPQAPAADNDSLGTIMIRLDSLNQKEFLNMAMAAAKASYAPTASIHDFEKALSDISRKKGVDEGFPSQFIYGADWIVDNVYRGNVKEMTEYLDGGSFRTKTLDYVSRHRDEFPAMSDSLVREKIKIIEMGYRSHRIPHLKKQSIGNKNVKELMQEGDIIMMLAPENDFDVYDLGIVTIKEGEPYLIHVSRSKGEVVEDDFPLQRLFKIESQFFYGYRWLRPTEY